MCVMGPRSSGLTLPTSSYRELQTRLHHGARANWTGTLNLDTKAFRFGRGARTGRVDCQG